MNTVEKRKLQELIDSKISRTRNDYNSRRDALVDDAKKKAEKKVGITQAERDIKVMEDQIKSLKKLIEERGAKYRYNSYGYKYDSVTPGSALEKAIDEEIDEVIPAVDWDDVKEQVTLKVWFAESAEEAQDIIDSIATMVYGNKA